MSNANVEKKPRKLYVIVNGCENLPDLRTEKEKKKGKESSWYVIFPDAKESLITASVQGLPNVTWMCECFLTLKSSSKSFSMSVCNDHSRKAGTASVKFSAIPAGDPQLKPGRNNQDFREAYRDSQPIQKQVINSTNTTISYWIWVLEFKEIKMSNLKKLKAFSKSATTLNKSANSENVFVPNLNPFEVDIKPSVDVEPANPFEEFSDKFGNSTFANVEYPKFRPSVWIPKESSCSGSLNNMERTSSLPDINGILKSCPHSLKDFKQNILEQKLTNSISESDLSLFKVLSDYYKTRRTGTKDEELLKVMDEEFFSVLNNLKRQSASNILKIKTLEQQNKDLNDELEELRQKMYQIKSVLIDRNLVTLIQNI